MQIDCQFASTRTDCGNRSGCAAAVGRDPEAAARVIALLALLVHLRAHHFGEERLCELARLGVRGDEGRERAAVAPDGTVTLTPPWRFVGVRILGMRRRVFSRAA